MPLSEQTRLELRAIRAGVELPGEFTHFMVCWIAFNRAYNELRKDEEELHRILGIADDLQPHWGEITGLASALVSLECIGAERIPQQTLLRPDRPVKSATIFLRNSLRVKPAYPDCARDPSFCRTHKMTICSPVHVDPWKHSEMAALMRLLYQVRCNLFHGGSRLTLADIQTNHDREMLSISVKILNTTFGWLC